MKIAVGADGNGSGLKEVVKQQLVGRGLEVVDFGVHADQDEDYPDVAVPVARAVAAGEVDRAVLVCGTGLGMAIVANKVRGVRAAPVRDAYSAERAIKSNNARVPCLGSLVVGTRLPSCSSTTGSMVSSRAAIQGGRSPRSRSWIGTSAGRRRASRNGRHRGVTRQRSCRRAHRTMNIVSHVGANAVAV